MMYSIFHVQGGLGKHVAATAVAQAIKNNHPDRKLIVVCAYPDIFINLNFVDRVFTLGNTSYFYQNYIAGNFNYNTIGDYFNTNGTSQTPIATGFTRNVIEDYFEKIQIINRYHEYLDMVNMKNEKCKLTHDMIELITTNNTYYLETGKLY